MKPPWKNHGNQPKIMINHETTLKNHGNQPKTTINHETTLKTMETNQNHEKPWIYIEKTRKPQTGLLGKWSFFVTHTQTLHHNIYIITGSIITCLIRDSCCLSAQLESLKYSSTFSSRLFCSSLICCFVLSILDWNWSRACDNNNSSRGKGLIPFCGLLPLWG